MGYVHQAAILIPDQPLLRKGLKADNYCRGKVRRHIPTSIRLMKSFSLGQPVLKHAHLENFKYLWNFL